LLISAVRGKRESLGTVFIFTLAREC